MAARLPGFSSICGECKLDWREPTLTTQSDGSHGPDRTSHTTGQGFSFGIIMR
jgi:hypothetical protein